MNTIFMKFLLTIVLKEIGAQISFAKTLFQNMRNMTVMQQGRVKLILQPVQVRVCSIAGALL